MACDDWVALTIPEAPTGASGKNGHSFALKSDNGFIKPGGISQGEAWRNFAGWPPPGWSVFSYSLAGPAGPSMFGMRVEKGSVGLAWGGTGFPLFYAQAHGMALRVFAVPWKGTAGCPTQAA